MGHEWNLNYQLPTPVPDMDIDRISSCVVLPLPPHKHPVLVNDVNYFSGFIDRNVLHVDS